MNTVGLNLMSARRSIPSVLVSNLVLTCAVASAPVIDQALANILDILAVAGAKGDHICRMTAYRCDKPAYMAARRELA